jgi:site-specific recombinase XerD
MDWGQTSVEFRRYLLSSGKAQATATTYVSNLRQFHDWCARYESRPHDMDRATVRNWIADRRTAVSAARAHNDLASLRHFYTWLIELGYRDDDPTTGIKVKRAQTLPTEPVWKGEFDALLAACDNERDRLIILMLAATGLRISELADLDAKDIDWQHGTIQVHGKGEKERRIAPNPEVLGRLHSFLGMFPEGPLWISRHIGKPLSAHQIRKIIYTIAERAHVENIHPHRFRAMFGTNFIEQMGDLQALQGAMGHSSPETTARYTQWTKERRQLEQMRGLNLTDRLVG